MRPLIVVLALVVTSGFVASHADSGKKKTTTEASSSTDVNASDADSEKAQPADTLPSRSSIRQAELERRPFNPQEPLGEDSHA